VKGVIRDRKEMDDIEREKRGRRIREMNEKMERMDLGGMTFDEENAYDEKEARRRLMEEGVDWKETRKVRQELRSGRFGHLREVGVTNFVSAIEGEVRGVWVVVHIYDKLLDRCILLDSSLSSLARSHPSVKFVRARAGAVGFASPSTSTSGSNIKSRRHHYSDEDEDDPYDSPSDPDTLGAADQPVDTDMLPTVLIYRDGQLVHNWVRVDWVIKEELGALDLDIQSLLERYGILDRNSRVKRGSGSDDSLDIEFEHELDY